MMDAKLLTAMAATFALGAAGGIAGNEASNGKATLLGDRYDLFRDGKGVAKSVRAESKDGLGQIQETACTKGLSNEAAAAWRAAEVSQGMLDLKSCLQARGQVFPASALILGVTHAALRDGGVVRHIRAESIDAGQAKELSCSFKFPDERAKAWWKANEGPDMDHLKDCLAGKK